MGSARWEASSSRGPARPELKILMPLARRSRVDGSSPHQSRLFHPYILPSRDVLVGPHQVAASAHRALRAWNSPAASHTTVVGLPSGARPRPRRGRWRCPRARAARRAGRGRLRGRRRRLPEFQGSRLHAHRLRVADGTLSRSTVPMVSWTSDRSALRSARRPGAADGAPHAAGRRLRGSGCRLVGARTGLAAAQPG
jgi:hypothetical protein